MQINNEDKCMKKFKKGFTIAEMLVVFAVIAVLAAILIPSIINNKPDKNKAMFRKAYYVTERVVAELISDEDEFPDGLDEGDAFAYYDPASDSRKAANRGKYFCNRFASKINISGDIDCDNDKTYDTPDAPSFVTNDGVYWYIKPNAICDPNKNENCRFPTEANPTCPVTAAQAPYICIQVDTNGPDGPNLVMSTGDTNVEDADRGWFYVFYNGKVQVPQGQPARSLQDTKVF